MLHLRSPITAARMSRLLPTIHSKLSHPHRFLSPHQAASIVSLSEPQRVPQSPRPSTRILLELPKASSLADQGRFESSCIYRATDNKYTRSFYAVVKCVPAPPTPTPLLKKACLGDSGSSTTPAPEQGTTAPIDAPADASVRLSRNQEIERGLQLGLSFVELGLQFKRTPEFIYREAGRFLGPQRLGELSRRVKKGEWSEGERKWLESKGCLLGLCDVGEVARLLRRRERGVRRRIEKMVREREGRWNGNGSGNE